MAIKSSGQLAMTEINDEYPDYLTSGGGSLSAYGVGAGIITNTGSQIKFSDFYGLSNRLEVLGFQTAEDNGGVTSYTWRQFWAPAGTKSFIIATAVNTNRFQDAFINSVTTDRALGSDEIGDWIHVTPVYSTNPPQEYNSFIAIGCANFATPTTAAQTFIEFTTYPAFTQTHFLYGQGFMVLWLNKKFTSRNPMDSGTGTGGHTFVDEYKDGIVVAASVSSRNAGASTPYVNFDDTSVRRHREPSYVFGYKVPSSNINNVQINNPSSTSFADRDSIAVASWAPSQFG
jgi:hypothetical protein